MVARYVGSIALEPTTTKRVLDIFLPNKLSVGEATRLSLPPSSTYFSDGEQRFRATMSAEFRRS